MSRAFARRPKSEARRWPAATGRSPRRDQQPGRPAFETLIASHGLFRCACGGDCPRCKGDKPEGIQTKLRISQPGDPYELEADRIAEAVLRAPEPTRGSRAERKADRPSVVPKSALAPPKVQRQPASEEDDEGLSQAKRTGPQPGALPAWEIAARIQRLEGRGQPLTSASRDFFEPRLGADFGAVRIHRGEEGAELARAVHARAFTTGRELVFGAGEYSPETLAGRRLLGHELVHVLQQRGEAGLGIQRQESDPQEGDPRIEPPPMHPPGTERPSIEPPPFGATINLLDPLDFQLRAFGFGAPSPRDILNGLEELRRFFRPPALGDPFGPPTIPPLSEEQIRQIGCRTLPRLCRPTPPSFPPLPPLRLGTPALRPPRIVHHDVRILDHFTFDEAGLPDRHRLLADRTATEMIERPNLITDVVGHTDSRGPSGHNRRLSERRSRTVRDHLLSRQVPNVQIWTVEGRGEDSPRFPNDATDHLAAARNRRVELAMRRLVFPMAIDSSLLLRLRPPSVLGATDPRPRVLRRERASFVALRDFIIRVRTGIGPLLAAPPPGEPWVTRDNENIIELLNRLDALIVDLRAENLVVRFNLRAAGNVAARYQVLQDIVRLRPFRTDQERAQVAASLVHEFAHTIQDRTAENLQRAARLPIEHTREDELRQETEARRHEAYFIRLMNLLGHSVSFHEELSARVFLGEFETVRTGSPRQQAAARRGIRQQLESAYAGQLATNAPARHYLIEIRAGRRAVLISVGGAEIDLGTIAAGVTTRRQLEVALSARVDALPNRAALFRGPGGSALAVLIFDVVDGGRKVAGFGARP